METPTSNGHSARVELRLAINGAHYAVAQVGPNSLVLREACEIPPATIGELTIKIDDFERRHRIRLDDGATLASRTVSFS
jgi:hypothetical protein